MFACRKKKKSALTKGIVIGKDIGPQMSFEDQEIDDDGGSSKEDFLSRS